MATSVYDDDKQLLAIFDGANSIKEGLNFYGNRGDYLQVGGFKYDNGKILRNHRHTNRPRTSILTQEVMVVLKGSCEALIFDMDDKLVYRQNLYAGQFVIVYLAGVGFKILEDDTVMIEAKNGPYIVDNDDEDRYLL